MDSNVEQFIDQLIDEKNYETLTDEVRQQMKEDLAQRLYDQIDQAMVNELSEEKAGELNDRLEAGEMSDEELAKFMEDAGVDMQKVVLQTMLTFRALFLTPPRDEEESEGEEPAEVAEESNA